MGISNISKRVADEKLQITALDSKEQEMMERLRALEEAEKRIETHAVPEGKRMLMEKAVRLDRHNIRRFLVKLTPSMCTARDCGYDAAVDVGYRGGWRDDHLHPEMILPNGQTVEDRLLRLLELHGRTAHAITHSHILTEEEAQRRKDWASVPPPFLTGA